MREIEKRTKIHKEYFAKKYLAWLREDSGNVESALVMIPLISLFLITLQLIATVNLKNVDMTSTQNRAGFQAVQQDVYPEDQLLTLNSGDFFSRLRLLIIRTERNMPQIFPGVSNLVGGKKIKTTGTAVYEESEECSGGYLLC